MKLKYELHFQHIGEEWIGVPVGKDAIDCNSMLHLNEVGHDIVEMMTKEFVREDIVKQLLDMYEVDEAEAIHAVDSAIEYLQSQDMLV